MGEPLLQQEQKTAYSGPLTATASVTGPSGSSELQTEASAHSAEKARSPQAPTRMVASTSRADISRSMDNETEAPSAR